MIGKALTLALLLLAFPLAGQEPPAPAVPAAPAGVPLSLADATARALANNNDIAIERESFHIVDASLLRADALYDPRSGWTRGTATTRTRRTPFFRARRRTSWPRPARATREPPPSAHSCRRAAP